MTAPAETALAPMVDYETAPGGKPELRLWLRLLTCSTLIEGEIRARLRQAYDVTLPRFDLMAQLANAPNGLTMSELSRRMMVSNGNVTGVTERLVTEGLVSRTPSPTDRRTQFVRLTLEGRRVFREMAERHEGWVMEMFDDLDADDVAALMRLLGKAKASVRRSIEAQTDSPEGKGAAR